MGIVCAAAGVAALVGAAASVGAAPAAGAAATPATATATAGFPDPTGALLAYVTLTETGTPAVRVLDTAATPPTIVGDIPVLLAAPATCPATATRCGHQADPLGVTAGPSRQTLYVAVSNKTGTVGAIDVIDAATNTVTKVVPVPGQPTSLAVGEGGSTLYVALNEGTAPGQVAAVPLAGGTVRSTALPAAGTCDIVSSRSPSSLAIGGAHGTTLVVLANGTSTTGCVDRLTVGATPATLTPQPSLPWTWVPQALAVDPTHPGTAYVSGAPATPAAGTVQAVATVDLATGSVVSTAVDPTGDPTPGSPSSRHYVPDAAAVSPDGAELALVAGSERYFTHGALWSLPVATLEGATASPAAVTLPAVDAATPTGIAYLPDGSALYVAGFGEVGVVRGTSVTTVPLAPHPVGTGSCVPELPPPPESPSPTARVGAPVVPTCQFVSSVDVAFGQAPATTPTTTTTVPPTTTTTVPPTTTTVPPTTSTTVPTPVTVPRPVTAAATPRQLAFTGEDPLPWLVLGGSLLVAGSALLMVDVRRRRRTAGGSRPE